MRKGPSPNTDGRPFSRNVQSHLIRVKRIEFVIEVFQVSCLRPTATRSFVWLPTTSVFPPNLLLRLPRREV